MRMRRSGAESRTEDAGAYSFTCCYHERGVGSRRSIWCYAAGYRGMLCATKEYFYHIFSSITSQSPASCQQTMPSLTATAGPPAS